MKMKIEKPKEEAKRLFDSVESKFVFFCSFRSLVFILVMLLLSEKRRAKKKRSSEEESKYVLRIAARVGCEWLT